MWHLGRSKHINKSTFRKGHNNSTAAQTSESPTNVAELSVRRMTRLFTQQDYLADCKTHTRGHNCNDKLHATHTCGQTQCRTRTYEGPQQDNLLVIVYCLCKPSKPDESAHHLYDQLFSLRKVFPNSPKCSCQSTQLWTQVTLYHGYESWWLGLASSVKFYLENHYTPSQEELVPKISPSQK